MTVQERFVSLLHTAKVCVCVCGKKKKLARSKDYTHNCISIELYCPFVNVASFARSLVRCSCVGGENEKVRACCKSKGVRE